MREREREGGRERERKSTNDYTTALYHTVPLITHVSSTQHARDSMHRRKARELDET